MLERLPEQAVDGFNWTWDDYKPYFDDLLNRSLTKDNVEAWLADWTRLIEFAYEVHTRLYIATTVNTEDEDSKNLYFSFLENVSEDMDTAMDKLSRKVLESGLQPENFEIPLREMRASVELFREENLPLQTELSKLGNQYQEISGAQTVEWDGEEQTLTQMKVMLLDSDREEREQVWRAVYNRQMEDRAQLNDLWKEMLQIRMKVAENAGKASFRDYQWMAFGRHDYTPEDDQRFLQSISEVVVPAMLRRMEKRKAALGIETLRPWDMDIDPTGTEPLKPFDDVSTLIDTTASIFAKLDPDLSSYYNVMKDNDLLDLDNRKGKAPGGYCTTLPQAKQSFIFMNSVGVHDNVQTLLHEAGHAFHNFEAQKLPYAQQRGYPTEFAEVASMSMELLAAPYFEVANGGFYEDEVSAARARIEHLDGIISFFPYMAVVDAFQHWVYENPQDAMNPDNCDAQWESLWDQFMPGVDWTGIEAIKRTGWHRKLHIFLIPFYYIEYGLAQLGAMQVWRNSLIDPAKALEQYRYGLSLGNTRKLPELFEAAGAKLEFDAVLLGDLIALV
ncbi:MAG: M3 family oligoendopeptidase, partial [Chloroflexota bacterium]